MYDVLDLYEEDYDPKGPVICLDEKTKQIMDKIEFHYTPKHASWLNAAEIEINVMD
jgi:hypothetical protein